MQTAYEHLKDQAAQLAGPACMEVFGEEPFAPESKGEALKLTKKQNEIMLSFDSRQSQMVNTYIPGDEKFYDYCLSGAGDRRAV